ncbi:MAG: aromatic amino acid lyase, partial [Proteobacteria bacterium]|nr:aromatic amino acid lyase [Pseudomonadota bacterium]
MPIELGKDFIEWPQLVEASTMPNVCFSVSSDTWERIESYRAIVEEVIAKNEVIYGINTGFGFLSDVKIESDKLEQLQLNLIRSHACGVGEYAPPEYVRALLVLRAHTFLLGHSAVCRSTVEKILEFVRQ